MAKKGGEPRAEGNSRGPKRDTRNKVTFRVEDPVFEMLVAMRPKTSLGPGENAALLLHQLITGPETIVAFLSTVLPSKPPAPGPAMEPPTDLASRRQAGKP